MGVDLDAAHRLPPMDGALFLLEELLRLQQRTRTGAPLYRFNRDRARVRHHPV